MESGVVGYYDGLSNVLGKTVMLRKDFEGYCMGARATVTEFVVYLDEETGELTSLYRLLFHDIPCSVEEVEPAEALETVVEVCRAA
jgi:hypothetical protein